MLSQRSKVHIESMKSMKQVRRRRTNHQHAVGVIAHLILSGEIEQTNDVRVVCKELNWNPNPTEELCDLVDDVGFTLLTLGGIERW